MKRYWFLFFGLMAFFLVLFGLAEILQIPLLVDPTPWLRQAGPSAMVIGVGLLILDVLLPVPSSVVMVLHGALFGLIWGALLSLIGCLGAATFGFALGRRGGAILERLVTQEEKRRADALLMRWGAMAVLITRPLPLVAEATAILAGASPMSWGRMLIAAFLGSLPASVLYAWAGSRSAEITDGLLMFAAVIALAGLFWGISRIVERRLHQKAIGHSATSMPRSKL